MSYACENTFGDAPTCKMKVGKKILLQDIDRAQVQKLLTEKKTDLLRGFVSQRTRRKFSAYLVMAADGKTSFEFEPRKEGAGPKKTFFRKTAPTNGKSEPGAGAEADVAETSVAKAKAKAPKKPRAKKIVGPAE